MDTIEEKIGYVIAKVEELSEDSKRVGEKLEALEERVDDKFKTAEATFRLLKFIGGPLLAILALPWTAIKEFYVRLFS